MYQNICLNVFIYKEIDSESHRNTQTFNLYPKTHPKHQITLSNILFPPNISSLFKPSNKQKYAYSKSDLYIVCKEINCSSSSKHLLGQKGPAAEKGPALCMTFIYWKFPS